MLARYFVTGTGAEARDGLCLRCLGLRACFHYAARSGAFVLRAVNACHISLASQTPSIVLAAVE